MEDFTSAVRTVCIVSAGICLIKAIAGSSKLKVRIDMLFKLLLAVVIVSPFVKEDIEIKLPDISGISSSDSTNYTDMYEKDLAERSGENISDVLMTQLKAAGVAVEKIRTEVNISHDGSISINRVIIETEYPDAAARIIRESLGEETEVVNGNI